MTASRIAVLAVVALLAPAAGAPPAAAQDAPDSPQSLGAAARPGGGLSAFARRARVHVSRSGRLGVHVGCTSDASSACLGVAVVRARMGGRTRTLARRRFRVAPGRERVVRLRLRPAARRRLARRRSLPAVIALRPGGAQRVTLVAA